jgi:membrane protein implicated in regulation of membrane protease activity
LLHLFIISVFFFLFFCYSLLSTTFAFNAVLSLLLLLLVQLLAYLHNERRISRITRAGSSAKRHAQTTSFLFPQL